MEYNNEMSRKCKNNWELCKTLIILEERDQVIVTTDKTNIFRYVDTQKYMTMFNEHLRCSSKIFERDKVRDL